MNEPAFRTRAEELSQEVASMPSTDDVAARLHRDFG